MNDINKGCGKLNVSPLFEMNIKFSHPQESRMESDYKKALDEGQVLVAYARIMFVGTGGVGKSSLLQALMNKKLPPANSTEVAELLAVKPQNLKAVGDESNPWVEVTDDDETNELVGLVLLVSNVAKGLTESSRFVQFMQGATTAAASYLRRNKSNIDDEYRQQVGSIKNEVVREVLSRAIKLAQTNPHAQAPDLEVLMRVWDCGGQSVYLDIVSAFLTPKTLTMLLYDARKDLNHRCVSLSHRNGVVTQSQQQNATYLDMLMQWMAAIYEMSTDKTSGSIPEYPRIITIGTHGDDPEVSANKESIVSQVLAECEGKAFTHIVGKGFIVNNKSAGGGINEDPTFKEIRKEVLDFAKQSSVTIATPVSWVLFRKVLEKVAKTQPVLTYVEAIEVAVSCSIPPSSLNSVLKFYHDVAVFLYFEDIPSMQGFVIASPQWLVKQLANLLALEGLQQGVGQPATWKPLREKGVLVEPLYKEVWKDSSLPDKSIMDLLKNCLLAAPIDTGQQLHRFPGDEYFVPSALPLCSDERLNSSRSHNVKVKESSLHLLFSTGYVPPGYLTRLAVALSKEDKCTISFSHGIFRNQFTFLYGEISNEIDEVVVTQNVMSIKINISRSVDRKSHNLPFPDTCRKVMNVILACSSDVRQWLPSITIDTAFACETCPSKNHFIVIPHNATTQSQLRCQKGSICSLSPTQQSWLKISSNEEGLNSIGVLSTAELQAVANEVKSEGKLKELADSLEMTVHYKANIEGATLLDRWQKEMEQFNFHARSHLVHHLRCVKLNDTAERLKYNQLQVPQATAGPSILPEEPVSEVDMLSSSRLMRDGDLEELAGALNISDDELTTVQSRFKNKQSQAHQLMCKWQTETNGSKQRLFEILRATGYHEAAKRLQGSETPRIKDLLRRVKTVRWYRLGLALDIDDHTMQKIEADTKSNPNMTEAALTRVFQEWLNNKENPAWSDISKALKVIGEKLHHT